MSMARVCCWVVLSVGLIWGVAGGCQKIAVEKDMGRLPMWGEMKSPRVYFEFEVSPNSTSLRTLCIDPMREAVFVSGSEGFAVVYSLSSGQEVLRMRGHSGYVLASAWSGDGSRIVTCSYTFNGGDDTVRIWDAQTGKELMVIAAEGGMRPNAVGITEDGRRIAWVEQNSSSGLKKMHVLDMQTQQRAQFDFGKGVTDWREKIAFSKDGNRVFYLNYRWDLEESPTLGLTNFRKFESPVLAFAPDRRTGYIVMNEYERDRSEFPKQALYQVDLEEGRLLTRWRLKEPIRVGVHAMDVSRDGKVVAISTDIGVELVTVEGEMGSRTLYTGSTHWAGNILLDGVFSHDGTRFVGIRSLGLYGWELPR